jgi:hypothetical protein
MPRDDLIGHHNRLPLGEDPRLRRTHTRHITNRVHASKRSLQSERIDRNPTVDTHPGIPHHIRNPMHRRSEKQIERQLAPIRANSHPPLGVEHTHQPLRIPDNATLSERREQRLRRGRRGRDRRTQRHYQRGHPAATEPVKYITGGDSAVHGVNLMTRLDQPGVAPGCRSAPSAITITSASNRPASVSTRRLRRHCVKVKSARSVSQPS